MAQRVRCNKCVVGKGGRISRLVIILVLPPGVVCQSNCALPMPGTADGDVRSWGEQAVSIMGQTSRCCMVCLMPQSQVSGSVENPHFNMLTLDRPTWVRNRLSAFQVVQGFSAPAGRCSSALMSRCTLASRGSSRSRHSSKRAVFTVVLMGLVHVIKLFCDLRRGTTPRCSLSGCLSSVSRLMFYNKQQRHTSDNHTLYSSTTKYKHKDRVIGPFCNQYSLHWIRKHKDRIIDTCSVKYSLHWIRCMLNGGINFVIHLRNQ